MANKRYKYTKIPVALLVAIGLLAVAMIAPGALPAQDSSAYFIDCGNFASSHSKMMKADGDTNYEKEEWYCLNNSGKRVGDAEVLLSVNKVHYLLIGRFLQGKAHGWWDIFELANINEVVAACFFDDGKPETDDPNCPEYLISLVTKDWADKEDKKDKD